MTNAELLEQRTNIVNRDIIEHCDVSSYITCYKDTDGNTVVSIRGTSQDIYNLLREATDALRDNVQETARANGVGINSVIAKVTKSNELSRSHESV